jgi:hypothetical protein
MDKSKLIDDVRHILDEQELVSEQELSTEDALPIDERIEVLYPAAMNDTQKLLPVSMLQVYDFIPEVKADLQAGTGYVTLPEDFLRLVSFKMQGWRRACTTAISEDSDMYAFQFNRATRGGCVSPVVAINADAKTLQYFSLPLYLAEHIVEKATYIKAASDIERDEIRQRGYDVLIWWLARSVAASFGRKTDNITEQIKIMLNGD